MELFETVLLICLILVAVTLCGLILIQQSRGSDIGAAFGSGAASTVFGTTGATPFLVKITAVLAVSFFLVTLGLAYAAKERVNVDQSYDFGGLPMSSESVDSTETTTDESPTDSVSEGDELPLVDDEESEPSEGGDVLPPIEPTDSGGDDLPESPDI